MIVSTTVDYTVGKTFGDSIRIGCVTFGASVTFEADIRCTLSVRGRSTIRVAAAETDRRVHIDFQPRALDVLERLVENFIADISRRLLKPTSFEQEFRVPNATRLEIEVDATNSRLYLQQ